MNNIKTHKHSRNISMGKTKTLNSLSFLKFPFNTSYKLHIFKTTNFSNNNKLSYKRIINSNLQKHNINKKKFGIIKINDLIDSKYCNIVAIFKDYLISDYIDEFLRRFYKKKESKNRIPKFSEYYKNYLLFFCKPTFSDFFANDIIQDLAETKAEIYYNVNYRNKKKEKKIINKEIAKTIFDSTIKESIDNIIIDTQEYISTISSQQTINLPDETILIINGQNKNSKDNSISSILKCFSNSKGNKSKNNKKLKKNDILSNSNKYLLNSIQKEIENIQIKSNINKSHTNKFKPTSTIPISSRVHSGNKVNLKYNNKNLKMTRIETSTSQNNLSSNRNKNKSKSKDFSNSKVINTQMSNSNFSRNKVKSPLNSPIINNRIFLTSNSPKFNNNNKKKKSNEKNNNNQVKNQFQLNKNNEHLNLKDIMKLTLQIYNDKSKNSLSKKNNNTTNNTNPKLISHKHTRSSPTINNFNININNHILLQNSISNSNNNINSYLLKKANDKNSPLKKNSPPNSRNKEKTFIRVNTDSQKKLNPYSTMSNYQNFALNTNKDIDHLLNNNFFSSFNDKSSKSKRSNKGFKTIRQNHQSPLNNKSCLSNDNLQKSHILSPKFIKNKGFFNNKKLKHYLNIYKGNNNVFKDKLNFPKENNKKEK